VQQYQQEVGWLGEKTLRFESHRFSVRNHGNNNGHIPAAIWPKVKAAALKKGYSLAALAYASGETVHTGHFNGYNAHVRRNLPRYRLAQYAKVLEDPELQALASEDIYWDEVVSIEAIGEQEVYDLCVPDGSNFVAQDIIVHNSGLAQAMLLNMARQLARTGGTCDYVTLEMTALQQARRMVASESQINSSLIRAGFRDVVRERRDEVDAELFARFTQAVERLRDEIGDVVYVQEEGLTVEQLRDHLTEVVTSRDCRLVVVDQLDLFTGPGGRETEQEHVSRISKALKQIARDLEIVVLCLVQLNRNLEGRMGVQGKRPQLADLRMSGRLEMDADMVLFLHRPCVYEPGLRLSHYAQYTEVWAGKVREGEAGGMVPLCFTGQFATFSDWPEGWLRPALEQDPEGEQAWEARLARLREEP
jgi:replicative DNA helicase